jgi:hypothetical protein
MPSLMTIPAEIRMKILKLAIPTEVTIDVASHIPTASMYTDESGLTTTIIEPPKPYPSNPQASIMLVCRQLQQDAAAIVRPVLVAKCDKSDFRVWSHCTSYFVKTFVDRVALSGVEKFVAEPPRQDITTALGRAGNPFLWQLQGEFGDVELLNTDYKGVSLPETGYSVSYEKVYKVAQPYQKAGAHAVATSRTSTYGGYHAPGQLGIGRVCVCGRMLDMVWPSLVGDLFGP